MASMLHSLLRRPRGQYARVRPDVSVAQCVEIMVTGNIGAVVVEDELNVLGILSERDVIRACLYKGRSPDSLSAADIVHADMTILDIHDPVEKAMEAMTETRRRHILVKDGSEIVDVVSIGDVVFYLLEENRRTIAHLENYIQGV